MDFQLFGNINDFGCAMVAGLAIILCGRESGLSKCFWGGCILVLLYANDSKLALLGALLEIAIFGVIKSDNYLVRRKDRWIAAFRNGAEGDRGYKRFMVWVLSHWRVSSVSVCFILLLAVLMSPIKINGYPISEMVRNAISQFYSGEFFEDSNESLLFRVNAITGMLTILKRSYFCGVGAGNTGIILREILPGMEGMFPNHIYVSPHVWWLELFSDIGSILIIPVLILFVYQIKCFFTSSYKDRYSLLQTMVLLSFPIWCMSASGLYTEYYTQSLLIVAIMGITRKISRSLRKEK